ncbi:LacI family DNA-binding transcriptional regulator [Chitinilyticum piscinae]|uniref:LacI family DNA-binding transcriptional regulator n=1 Tax=Chitinilyticum piscinae TaxID=2866724 RepID=A0A8J7FU89_9NEIS|nr:LacI family DNA-binding transcriptional regulator [Chitinilyticum piscinae]MBE9610686.1 LacI family DNA-binding transcriptional regulator [Chitinilyticum piscinae]
MSISLRELADAAGVSVGTASRALKHQGGVSEATRQKVIALAAELDYDQHRLQRAPLQRVLLLLHRSHATPATAPFYAELIAGAEQVCSELGISLQPFVIDPSGSIRRQVLQQQPDGLLCVGFIEPDVLDVIRGLGKPLALIDTCAPGLASVNPDNEAGTRVLTEHLLARGCRRIAFVSGSLAHHSIRLRERGYRQALFNAGLLADPALEVLIPAGVDLASGAAAALDELLALASPPDAIIAFNDACALALLDACRLRGVRVPDDLAIAGFDDIPASGAAGLSTVNIDKAALGAAGVTLLLAAAEHQPASEPLHPVSLVLRSSTGPHCQGDPHAPA